MADVEIKLTSGVAIGGEVYRPGASVSVSNKMARDLIARGKAEVVGVMPEADAAPAEPEEYTDEALRELAEEHGLRLGRKFNREKWLAAVKAYEAGAVEPQPEAGEAAEA